MDPEDESEEEILEISMTDFGDATTWLLDPEQIARHDRPESVNEVCKALYKNINDNAPDISNLCQQLLLCTRASTSSSEASFASHRALIDSRTFTRPKKSLSRPSLTSMSSDDDGRVKLQRRLTTTITPTPNLISKLEELSKVNNRPVSGNYTDVNWEDGSEALADVGSPQRVSKRQSVPASLFDRLQELKKLNNAFVMPKLETSANASTVNGKVDDVNRGALLEDVKKLTANFDLNARKSTSAARLSEIFKNTPEYFSDDNESFISLDEVSGFCDRLTLSTDQNSYSAIVREMEEQEICLFHRTSLDEIPLSRMTFGGQQIPSQLFLEDVSSSSEQLVEVEFNEKVNRTFEVERNESVSKLNVMNTTYGADKKPGIMDVIIQSDIIKNLSPNFDFANHNNLDLTTDKVNGVFNKNEINSLNNEKYTSKIFDATFKKQGPVKSESQGSPNGKKDSDHSEDDCMSTTSDNSYRSVESNSELKNIEELKSIAIQQSKKLSDVKFSTPKTEGPRTVTNRHSDEWRTFSPIRKDIDECGSQGSSNSSSRGPSPRISSAFASDQTSAEAHKQRTTNMKQTFKVPQRELKLKPALIRPTQNFKRPVSHARAVSEPNAPCKVEVPLATVPVVRPAVPPAVPSQPNIRTAPRISGIPRPPSRLKQPQIRTSAESLKK